MKQFTVGQILTIKRWKNEQCECEIIIADKRRLYSSDERYEYIVKKDNNLFYFRDEKLNDLLVSFKKIVVEKCSDCPFFWARYGVEKHCVKSGKIIKDESKILNDCELENN